MAVQYKLQACDRILMRGQPFATADVSYPGNWLDLASDEDLAAHGIVKETVPDEAPPAHTADDVTAERNKRLQVFSFGGKVYDLVDDKGSEASILGAFSLAFAAVIAGAQPGDLRWSDPSTDFEWIAADNTTTTMDAQTVIAFGKAASAYKSKMIFKARALKNMSPIPTDYRQDDHWS